VQNDGIAPKTVCVQTQSGADGVLHLGIPVDAPNADYEVIVEVRTKAHVAKPKTPDERGWPAGFFEATALSNYTSRGHE